MASLAAAGKGLLKASISSAPPEGLKDLDQELLRLRGKPIQARMSEQFYQ